MTYKSAKVYTGSEWVDLAVSVADATQRVVIQDTGTARTLGSTDAGKAIVFTNSNPITVTVPNDDTYNFAVGQNIILIQKGTGQVTVASEGTAAIRYRVGFKTYGQYSRIELLKIAANEWSISGDLG